MKIALVVLLQLFASVAASGQAVSVKIRPDRRYMKQPWENYYSQIPVSGETRVGLMAFETADKVVPTSFFVRIPEHKSPILSVEVSSRDGRYQANLFYDISSIKPQVIELELPTRYISELHSYTVRDITILSKIVPAKDRDPECYVLSCWNRPAFKNNLAYVYLNSEHPTDLILEDSHATERIIECNRITEGNSVSYNCSCVISGYNLEEYKGSRIRQIISKRPPRKDHVFLDFPVRF